MTNPPLSELGRILELEEGPRKVAALAAWVQGLYGPSDRAPVLVGGAAVELYTGGAYRTGDLDFVGAVPSHVRRRLEDAGFERQGRHFVHEEGQLFLEFPDTALEEGDTSARMIVGDTLVLVLGLEELIVDRLAAWQFWESEIDAVNALRLSRTSHDISWPRLHDLARAKGVGKALDSLSTFRGNLGSREPGDDELRTWVRSLREKP